MLLEQKLFMKSYVCKKCQKIHDAASLAIQCCSEPKSVCKKSLFNVGDIVVIPDHPIPGPINDERWIYRDLGGNHGKDRYLPYFVIYSLLRLLDDGKTRYYLQTHAINSGNISLLVPNKQNTLIVPDHISREICEEATKLIDATRWIFKNRENNETVPL